MNILAKLLSAASSAASGKLVLGLAGALVLSAAAFGVQTWRIGQLHQALGGLKAEVDECVRANLSNQRTIKNLTDAAARNRKRAEEALAAQRDAVEQINTLEAQIVERASDDITAIQHTDDACGNTRMPDDIRLRLDPRRDRDKDSRGGSGTVGASRRGTDTPHPPA